MTEKEVINLANQKMNKTEGSVETCSSCGTEVICVMKPASGKYGGKLQWQNKDGKAHYFFDHTIPEPKKGEEDKRFTCVIPSDEIPVREEKQEMLHDAKDLLHDTVQTFETVHDTEIGKEIEELAHIDGLVTRYFKLQHGDNFNPAEKSMWVKEIYKKIPLTISRQN